MKQTYQASKHLEASIKGIEKRLKRIKPYCQKSENFEQHVKIIELYLSSMRLTATHLKIEGM